MNKKAIAAYAARILKAGSGYAIFRRDLTVLFTDGLIILNVSECYGLPIVPHVMGKGGVPGAQDYALQFGRNCYAPGPNTFWRGWDQWVAAPSSGLLMPDPNANVEITPLHERWPHTDKPDTGCKFIAPDNSELFVNLRLLNLIAPWPYRAGAYTLDQFGGDAVRIRESGGAVSAIMMPLKWNGVSHPPVREKAEATA